MCVGFLRTAVISDPSEPSEARVSNKGKDLCGLGVLVVNCMWEMRELKWVRNCWECTAL